MPCARLSGARGLGFAGDEGAGSLGWISGSGGFAKSRADHVEAEMQDWLQKAVARNDLHN